MENPPLVQNVKEKCSKYPQSDVPQTQWRPRRMCVRHLHRDSNQARNDLKLDLQAPMFQHLGAKQAYILLRVLAYMLCVGKLMLKNKHFKCPLH